MPLYKEDLDQVQCSCGRIACEDPVFLHSGCHIKSPTWCSYFDGVLTVRCAECKKIVAEIAVAKKESDAYDNAYY